MKRAIPKLLVLFSIAFLFKCAALMGQAHDEVTCLVLRLDYETAAPDFFDKAIFQEYEGLLYYLNHTTRDIKVFDLASGELTKTINLRTKGPNSVGPEPRAFLVVSQDSIYVYSDFNGDRVSLVNGSGELVMVYDYLDGKGDSLLLASVVASNSAFALWGNQLFAARSTYDYNVLNVSAPLVSIDLLSQEKTQFPEPLMYPHRALYKVPKYGKFLSPSIIGNDSLLVLSYPLDHRMYFSSDGFKTLSQLKVQSKFIPGFEVLDEDVRAIGEGKYQRQAKDASLLSGRYFNLLYSSGQGVYYRLVRLPFDEVELSNYRQGLIKRMKPQEYSIMTLKRDFSVMSEVKYSGKDYLVERGVFVDDRGLWVLKNSSDNEDEMVFELLSLN